MTIPMHARADTTANNKAIVAAFYDAGAHGDITRWAAHLDREFVAASDVTMPWRLQEVAALMIEAAG